MKVVGLLSGGKDSCFNLCHCVLQGHEIVALATLAPPEGKDEIDSYMYQTVGHDAVHAVAQALQLPLYRAEIAGRAVNQEAVYGARVPHASGSVAPADDETEDLYRLLKHVQQHHPDIEGVSVGAILSNYQRVRVEHVACRPDLQWTPLAFLWQRNQAHLLSEMADAMLSAVLIKAAGIGLTERDLGRSLVQLQPKLAHLVRICLAHNVQHAAYGAHVCGEGGEYETLTVDAPLFAKRLALTRTETVVHSEAAFASVSYLRILATALEDKAPGTYGPEAVRATLRAPPLLDRLGTHTYTVARTAYQAAHPPPADADPGAAVHAPPVDAPHEPTVCADRAWLAVGYVVGTPAPTLVDEAHRALEGLATTLHAHGYTLLDVAHLDVALRSQDSAPAFYAALHAYFGAAPPTHTCFAVPLTDARLRLEAVAYHDTQPHRRRALHVQSRSYWAPAARAHCSQAVCTDHRIWMSAQTGCIPATLALPDEVPLQVALALQHARRTVLAAREWSFAAHEGYVEGGLCLLACAPEHVPALSHAVAHVWREAHHDAAEEDHDAPHAHQQADDAAWRGTHATADRAPLLVVQLAPDALPQHAALAWQLTASTGRSAFAPRFPHTDADAAEDDEEAEYKPPLYASGRLIHREVACTYHLTYAPHLGTMFGIATLVAAPHQADDVSADTQGLRAALARALCVRLVARTPGVGEALLERVAGRRPTAHLPAYAFAAVGEPLRTDGAGVVFMC